MLIILSKKESRSTLLKQFRTLLCFWILVVGVWPKLFVESRDYIKSSKLNRIKINSRSMNGGDDGDICIKYHLNVSESVYQVGDFLMFSVNPNAAGLFQAQKTIEDVLYGGKSFDRNNDAVKKNREYILYNWKSKQFFEPSITPGRLFGSDTDFLEFVTTFHLCKLLKKTTPSSAMDQKTNEIDNNNEEVEKYLQQYLRRRRKRDENQQLGNSGHQSSSNSNQELKELGIKLFDDDDDNDYVANDYGSGGSKIDDYFGNIAQDDGNDYGVDDINLDKISSSIIEKQTDFIKNQHDMIDQKLEKVDSKLGTLMQALNEYNKLIKLKYLQKYSKNDKIDGSNAALLNKQRFRKFQQQFRNKKAFRMWLRRKLLLKRSSTTTTTDSTNANEYSTVCDSDIHVLERTFAETNRNSELTNSNSDKTESKDENVKEVFHNLLHSHFGKLVQNSDENANYDNDDSISDTGANKPQDHKFSATTTKEPKIVSYRSNEPSESMSDKCPIIVMATFRIKKSQNPATNIDNNVCNDFDRDQSFKTMVYRYAGNRDQPNYGGNNYDEGMYPDHVTGDIGPMPRSIPILKPLKLGEQQIQQLLRYRGVIQMSNNNDQLVRIRPNLRCIPPSTTNGNQLKPIVEMYYPSAFTIEDQDYFHTKEGELKLLSPDGNRQSKLMSIENFLNCASSRSNQKSRSTNDQKIRDLVEDFPELQDLSYAKNFRIKAVNKKSDSKPDNVDDDRPKRGNVPLPSGESFKFDKDYDSELPDFSATNNKNLDDTGGGRMSNNVGDDYYDALPDINSVDTNAKRKSKRNKNNASFSNKNDKEDDDEERNSKDRTELKDKDSDDSDKKKKKEDTDKKKEKEDKINSRNADTKSLNDEEEEELKKQELAKSIRRKWWTYGSIVTVLFLAVIVMTTYSRKTKPNEDEEDEDNSRRHRGHRKSKRSKKSSKKSTKSSKSRRTSKTDFDSDDSEAGDNSKSTFKSKTSRTKSKSRKSKSRPSSASASKSKSRKSKKRPSSSKSKSKSRKSKRGKSQNDENSFTMSPIEASLNQGRSYVKHRKPGSSSKHPETTTTDPQSEYSPIQSKQPISKTPLPSPATRNYLEIPSDNACTPNVADHSHLLMKPLDDNDNNDNVIMIDPNNLKEICTDSTLAKRLEQMVNESKLITRLWNMKQNLESILVPNKDNGDNNDYYTDSGRFGESSIEPKPGFRNTGFTSHLQQQQQAQSNASLVKYGNNGEILSLEDDIPDDTAIGTNYKNLKMENPKQQQLPDSKNLLATDNVKQPPAPPDAATKRSTNKPLLLKSSPPASSSWPQTASSTKFINSKQNQPGPVSEENAKFIQILHRLRKSLKAVYRRPSELAAIKSL